MNNFWRNSGDDDQDMNWPSAHKILEADEEQGEVWVGDQSFILDVLEMTKNNIGAVLSAIECILPQTLRSSTVQLCIPIFDANNQPIRQYFEKVYNFIEEQRMTTNVVVHCAAGISRSVALLISYIMKKHGYGFNTSFKMIKSIRINASPNNGFQNQLKAYEKELQEQKRQQNMKEKEVKKQ